MRVPRCGIGAVAFLSVDAVALIVSPAGRYAALARITATSRQIVPVSSRWSRASRQAMGMRNEGADRTRGEALATEELRNAGVNRGNRAVFLRNQGALGGAVLGLLGLSGPANAAIFDLGQNDVIKPEDVSQRMMIGRTQSIKWSTVAPSITAMRTEARERFAKTGADGGREVTAFFNQTPEGADVSVGLEVATSTSKTSAALGEGFTATMISPPGLYLKDEHATEPGMLPWITFMARASKEGFALKEPLSMFEVYTGNGGKEGVTMYAAIDQPRK